MFRRRADTPKKYEHIDFTPPEGAANAAEKGLEYREKASPSNKGGLTPAEASKEGIGSGVQRAVNLKNRNTLSPDTIKQMHGFFSRHEQNKGIAPENEGKPWNDKGHVSWLLWGGDAARSWVDKVLGQMEKADEKEKAGSKKASSEHAKSLALAKFLGRVAQRAGVAQHVYIVGGAVRNFLLDQPIKDIDVVVDSVALRGYDSEKFAKEVARSIPMTTNLTTNQYGVAILTVKGPWLLDGEDMDGEVIEIANARGESYGGSGGKGYKPSEVVPATIEEDVYRREFTFNTLLWRLMDVVHGPERAEVIDLTGCGRADLERKVMRCPRDPDVVFADDPTRMLRALKFAIKYGFDVPPDLQASIKRNARKLAGVPYEAVGTILVRDIFGTPRAREMLRFMDKLGLLDVIRDMVGANKGFATYLSGQLSAQEASFLLDMDDYGMGVRLPLSFLSPEQRVRVRGVLENLPSTEQADFLAALTRPQVDNGRLIQQFNLKPQDRGRIQPAAREALLDNPALAGDPAALTEAVARQLAGGRTAHLSRAAVRTVLARQAVTGMPRVASTTGDGSEVGFFIPLSADLASQYEVKVEDTSPPHVTFLYVGKVTPEQVPTLLRVAHGVLGTSPSVFGVLNGVDSFVKKEKDQRVMYSRVSFSHDLKPLRDRLWEALTEAGFKVEQAFPHFTPHVTIEYRDGVTDAVLDGAVPSGSWDCKTVEVWGLPKKYALPLGGGMTRNASGEALLLDDLGYGNLSTDDEGTLLTPSSVFPADVLAHVPQVPCPENSSEETKRELAHLLKLQHKARPYLAQQVAVTDENATATLEAYCAKHGLDASGVLPVTHAVRPVLLQLKRYYDRPRPYQLAAHLESGFHPMPSTTAHTPSYPSGHSAQAVLVALLLSGLYPDHRDAFMALAQEVGTHRMVGGYHFPSDVVYGEQVGHALYASMARASVRTAAAKYKEKKKVPKADGSGKTTVYVYSERQVANRHREKAERLEDFKPALAELRAQVKKDLDSDDAKKAMTALAVGLIDATYERVGNEDSADKGHYGVTGWLRKHVTFKGKRAVIRYVGKSGVKHEKSVDDDALVGALKKCCGDKDGEEPVLSLGKHTVTSDEVNEYLKPYDITAKDLRGLHANREMQERLRAIRSKGPKLPRLRKERDPILKDEFKQALEGAAEAVGHEPATLRKQYLVPSIEKAYMKDGTVPRDFTASTRVAASYRQVSTHSLRLDPSVRAFFKQFASVFEAYPNLWVKGGGARDAFVTFYADYTAGYQRATRSMRDIDLVLIGGTPVEKVALLSRFGGVVKSEDLDIRASSLGQYFKTRDVGINEVALRPDTMMFTDKALKDLQRGTVNMSGGEFNPEWGDVSPRVGLRSVLLAIREGLRFSDKPMVGEAILAARPFDLLLHLYKAFDTGVADKFYAAVQGNPYLRNSYNAEEALLNLSEQVHDFDRTPAQQRTYDGARDLVFGDKWEGRVATKSDAEREDEEAERLLKPEPKYKPPRGDLRRRRVETEQDADPDKRQDDKDRSQNYKDATQRVAAAWLFRTAKTTPVVRDAEGKVTKSTPKADEPKSEGSGDADKALKERAQNEFDAYAKNHPDTELDVADFLKRIKAKEKRKSDKKGEDDEGDDSERDAEELKAAEAERKTERVKQAVKDIAAEWDGAENSVPMSEENHDKISEAIKSFTPKDREKFVKAFTAQRKKVVGEHTGYDPDAVKDALHDLTTPLRHKNPEGVAEKAVRAIFADRVLLNPLLLTPDNPLSSETGKTDEPHPVSASAPRVKQAMERFSQASDDERTAMSERVTAALRNCRPKSPQHEELLAVQFGLNAVQAFPRPKGDDEGGDEKKGDAWGKPPKGMSGVEFGLLKHLHGKGKDTSELVSLAYRSSRKDGSAADDTRKFVQDTVKDMSMNELNDILPEDLQSLSAAFLSIRKSLSAGGGAKRDQEIAEQESEIAERLRTTLVDCVSEAAVNKADPKAAERAAKAAKAYMRDNPAPAKSKKLPAWDEWIKNLVASFKKAFGLKTASLAYEGESPTVRGYTLLPLPHSVGGLYPR